MNVKESQHFYLKQFRAFVPPDSFDAHAHLYRGVDAVDTLPRHLVDEQGNVGWQAWHQALLPWMGDRSPNAGLFFTFPKLTLDRDPANQFVLDELKSHPDSRALMMIRPQDDPSAAETEIETQGYAGFKVYHCFADRPDTFNAESHEFLPRWAWEIANQHGLAIMLHLVRNRAVADVANQEYIREYCLRYPNAKLILAHAARGFCGAHTVEGIASLRGLENVYFDTSAICEAQAFEAILREFGPRRLLFGTDFPISELRGRCVSIGDGFLWLSENNVSWEEENQPALIGVESLLALQQACRTMRLTDGDVEQIFSTNARQLLGLQDPPDGRLVQEKYERAKEIIPGGTQLLSKRPEMFAPGHWPAYYSEARGCEIVDLEGRRFCDMTTTGIGACLLGYSDPDVTDAVVRRVQLGSMCSLNSVEEVELAELLISLHPWAEQVRYCRTGGESMAVAVRIARAYTQRDRIAFCGYHGWSDWYLAANLPEPTAENSPDADRLSEHLLPGLAPEGVPKVLGGTALPFAYNQLDELHRIVKEHGPKLAAIVMEPFRATDPEPGFLEGVRELSDQCGAALVFDEITTGWRYELGGIHLRYGIEPDIAVFAKAISNGHPMGAILGRGPIMEAAQSTFVSSTYWTEAVGPTAALATIRKMQQVDVPAHIEQIGQLFKEGLMEVGREHGVPVRVTGRGGLLHIAFDHPESAALSTLKTTRMLEHGFLSGGAFYPTLAHTERHVKAYLEAVGLVFKELADAIQQNNIGERLGGAVRHSDFARLT